VCVALRQPKYKDAVPDNVGSGVIMGRSAPRKKTEVRGKLLPDLFNSSAVGLAIFDTHLRYQALNPTLAAMHGVPAEFHLGKSLREILGDIAARVEPAIKQVLTTGQPILNLEVAGALTAIPGRRRWVDHLFPLKDAKGRVNRVGLVVVERPANVKPRPTDISQASQAGLPDSDVLRSWKDISNYLKASVKTVQRWEQTHKLPVRRLRVAKGATVFALSSEIDEWVRRRAQGSKTGIKRDLLRAMFLNSPLPALVVGDDRVILDANVAMAHLIGATRDEVIGGSLNSLMQNSSLAYNKREWQSFQKVGVSVGFRNIARADGSIFGAEYILKRLFPGLQLLTLISLKSVALLPHEEFYQAGLGKLELHRKVL
jgi:PAS domain S-box-containing protein